MPCVLARTSSVGVARPSRELATTPRAEGHANIPPRKRGRSWGRGHRRSQAPSPGRPQLPTRADPALAFVKHLQDAGPAGAAPAHSGALAAVFPDAALSPPAAAGLPLHMKREYTAAVNALALFCPATVSTVDLGGNDWQAPASPHVITSSSLRDMVEAARLSDAATEPGVVTSHDASVVRKLGLGSCNLPEPRPSHPAAHPTPSSPSAPRRRLPPTPALSQPPSPTLRTSAAPAARLRCGAGAATPIPPPAPDAPPPTPAVPLRSGPLAHPPAASRLRSHAHAAPLPGLGASRPRSPARPPTRPTAPRLAAVCGPRRRIISEAVSSTMHGLLAPVAAPAHALPAPLDSQHHPDAHPTPATPLNDPIAARPLAAHAPSPAARLVAEHLGLGGQLLGATDEVRLGAVLESFDALAGPGFVPRHVGPQQYTSWLVRRSGGEAAGVWHAAVQCALAPLLG